MTVSSNTIRVQLPGNAAYAPAFSDAASKVGDRSGLPKRAVSAFTRLIELGVDVLISGSATLITLEIEVHDKSIEAKLIGKGCSSPAKATLTRLGSEATKRARSFDTKETKSSLIISFEV